MTTDRRRNATSRLSDLLPSPVPSLESDGASARTCDACGWECVLGFEAGTRPALLSDGVYDNHDPDACVYASLPGGCGPCEGGLRVIDRVVYCRDCEDGATALEATVTAREAERRAYLRSVGLMRWEFASGIPERFRACELGPPLSPALVKAMRREPGAAPESWLLYGDYGRGKTGAAVGYARQFVLSDDGSYPSVAVLFRAMPDLLTELRATYDRDKGPSEADLIEVYRSIGLLVLDDLGAEQVGRTGWLEDRLYQIVGARHAAMLPTVFTSNLTPAQLGDRLGERVMWRILELCGPNVVEVVGPNLRATEAARTQRR